MKKLLAIAILISTTSFLLSCGNDDNNADPLVDYDDPMVELGSFDIIFSGEPAVIPFTITLDPDLTADATWSLTSAGDITASIGGRNTGTVSSGTIVNVDILPGAAGDASITLRVTNPSQDPDRGSTTAKVNFNVN